MNIGAPLKLGVVSATQIVVDARESKGFEGMAARSSYNCIYNMTSSDDFIHLVFGRA